MAINFRILKRKDDDINKMLKRFKKYHNEFGISDDVKERQEYKKPTTVKRRLKQEAVRKQKWEQEKIDIENGQFKNSRGKKH